MNKHEEQLDWYRVADVDELASDSTERRAQLHS
jgi:hypothetical protein